MTFDRFLLSCLFSLVLVGAYAILFKSQALLEGSWVWITLTSISLAALCTVGILQVKQLLHSERFDRSSYSKLQIYLSRLFLSAALIPAILVIFFTGFFLDLTIKRLFDDPVKGAIYKAMGISEAYLKEHKKSIGSDALRLAIMLRPQMPFLVKNPAVLKEALNEMTDHLGLSEILIFNQEKQIVAKSYITFTLSLEKILNVDFEQAKSGEVVIRSLEDRVRALVYLDSLTNTFLFVGKRIEPKILQDLDAARFSVQQYNLLLSQQGSIRMVFIVYMLLLIGSIGIYAIRLAIRLGNHLFRSISELIAASEQVSQGNLSVQVASFSTRTELDWLVQTFNQMVMQLNQQQKEIRYSQRQAAWADIARRIAHEIKNPLTPIQLAAERLKRRYLEQIHSDPQTFQSCINTIIRQVQHIQKLVQEFSDFARMPSPLMETHNLSEVIRVLVSLQQQAYPTIQIETALPEKDVHFRCDAQQIDQVLLNLIQNAIHALVESPSPIRVPRILIQLTLQESYLILIVQDNGPGFPIEDRDRLLEPYYTTRPKGNGLGLAIVGKIVRDHGGVIELGTGSLGGAFIKMTFNSQFCINKSEMSSTSS